MHIHTIEENYDYRMRNIIEKFVEENCDLQDLTPGELQDKIWSCWAKEFGRMVLEDMNDFSGDELFEIK